MENNSHRAREDIPEQIDESIKKRGQSRDKSENLVLKINLFYLLFNARRYHAV